MTAPTLPDKSCLTPGELPVWAFTILAFIIVWACSGTSPTTPPDSHEALSPRGRDRLITFGHGRPGVGRLEASSRSASSRLVLLAGFLTDLTLLLLAGHVPGRTQCSGKLSPRHGLNTGDLPVLVAYLVGPGCCAWIRRSAPSHHR